MIFLRILLSHHFYLFIYILTFILATTLIHEPEVNDNLVSHELFFFHFHFFLSLFIESIAFLVSPIQRDYYLIEFDFLFLF